MYVIGVKTMEENPKVLRVFQNTKKKLDELSTVFNTTVITFLNTDFTTRMYRLTVRYDISNFLQYGFQDTGIYTDNQEEMLENLKNSLDKVVERVKNEKA